MRKLTRPKIEAFLARHASDKKTLDIGAGGEDHLLHFPNRTTIDIDPARQPDVVGDVEQLPFPDASFEVVVCSEVLEHIRRPERAIAEMGRVLIPGGLVVLTTRFAFPVHDAPTDYWRFTPYGLAALFEEWEIIEQATDGGPFHALAVELQRINFQTKLTGGKATKFFLELLARLFARMDGLVLASYGDITRASRVPHLLSTGVFIACQKR